ncbi:ESPR-type extended signal peptide-containing protein [Phascolarctobacterium faecium]|uniref:ESPR-type extended signal peptide-containing protein n=1 Tax=Phascolarctobacterium faecium TaxID=33025 RepID=UPI003AB1C8B6
MNKVYKVIWSNAKNCYVVVSELAKSRVKAVNLCKTLVAVSILTAVVSDGDILARAYAEEKESISVEEEIIDDSERYISEEDIIDEEKINKTMSSKAAGDKKPGTTVKYDNIITGEVHAGHASGEYGDIAIGENSSVNRVMQDPNGNGEWGEDTSAAGVAVGANASVMGGGGTAVGQNSKTVGVHSLAVGSHAQTFGVDSISIGASASVGSEGSDTTGGISVGTYASVTGQHGIAIGSNSNTNGPAAVSIGHMSNAAGSNAIAIGTLSKVEADSDEHPTEGIAIGSNAYTSGFHGVALGAETKSIGRFSVALGEESIAKGNYSTALGAYSYTSGFESIAIGRNSNSSNSGSIAIGAESEANAEYSSAFGVFSEASGFQSMAFGYHSKAGAQGALAAGTWSEASGLNSIATGYSSKALETDSIAIGRKSNSEALESIAVGAESSVTAKWSTALGSNSTVSGQQSTALGYYSNVTGEQATALGSYSKASHENSVALGSNSETAEAVGTSEFTLKQLQKLNGQWTEVDITFGEFAGSDPLATVSVGKEGQYRTITNVAAGRISATSTDAINGSQLFAVADGLQNQINDINKKIDNSGGGSSGDDHYHTVNGNDKEDKTDISNNTDITNNNQDNDVIEKADDINTPASGNSGGTNTDPVGDKPALGGDYVGGEDGNLLIKHDTDSYGNEYYDISLNQDLNINSMNVNKVQVNEEIKVGDDITINKDNGITVGDVNINKNEIKVGDKVTINDNSVNVGDVSINEDNIDMGGNKIINVAEGTEGTDAVNVNQLNKLEQNVNNKINRLDGKIDKVGAGAAALAALHPLDFDPDDKLNFSAGVGNYHGSTAAAIGAFYQPNDDTLFSIGGTVGNGDEMVNVGVSFRFGQHSNQSRSKKAMAKEIIELRTEIAELKAMMYSLTGQGFDPYKSKIFPDTPENHWAYDYVAVVAGNGILEGYPNGRFDGSSEMTRYEMAAVIYRLMTKGIQVDERMLKEFAPELARVKVDTLTHHEDGTPSIQRVRIIEGRG